MNSISTKDRIITLDDISKRKDELKLSLDESKTVIVTSVKDLFTPPPAVTSGNALMRNLGTGLVVFNGIKSGLKVIRIAKSIFNRLK